MSKDQNNGFSILKELWFPSLFGFILVVLMTGGYFLMGKESKPSLPALLSKEAAPQDYSKNALLFLELLKAGSKEKAYELVSKPFKEAMPYQKFIQFVSDYPILTAYDKLDAGAPQKNDQDILLTVTLHGSNGALPVHFTLVKEGGEWKILGFVINQPSGAQDLRDLDAVNTLKMVVIQFLNTLREGKIDDAYQTFTSEVFQSETSKENFVAFVNERPLFRSQTQGEAIDGHIDGARGYLRMFLLSDGEKTPVDFGLHSEKGGWKIEGMYVLTPPQKKIGENSPSVEILEGTVGGQLEPDGSITRPIKELSKNDPIYLSLLLDVSGRNAPLQVSLMHLATDAQSTPVSTTIPKEGLTRLSFSFTTPPGGFPPGKYILRVTSGETTRDFNFRIND